VTMAQWRLPVPSHASEEHSDDAQCEEFLDERGGADKS
jgi:hypothetical protein